MVNDMEWIELRPYHGYGISKVYEITETGKKIPGTTRYVVDDGEDAIGEEYYSLEQARNYINSIEA